MKNKFLNILLLITACLSLITMTNLNVNAKSHLKPRIELVATYNLKKVSKKTLKQFYEMKRTDHNTNVYVSHGKVQVSMILPGGSPKAPLKKMNFVDMPCNNDKPKKIHSTKHVRKSVNINNKNKHQ